jgi:dipeptidyl aminopeptidase/acylaminoacyl peptidase
MMPGDQLVTQPESFRQATFSRDREDLEAVLAAVGNELAAEQSDPNRIGLIGHSRGGGDAILAAGFGSQRERLKALVTWSAVSTFDRLSKAEKDQWRQNESITVVNARTGQKLPVHVAVLEDLERKGDALIPLHAAEQVRAPWLIIHGGEDETVNAGEARLLAQAAKKSRSICELQILDEAGHTFGAQHPFVAPTPDLITAMNATQTWLRRYLVPANSDR